MKKFLAFYLCFCIILIGTTVPVFAANPYDVSINNENVASSEEQCNGQVLALFEVNSNDDTSLISTYNVDLEQVSGPYWQNYVNVAKGKNMKVHVNITSYAIGCNSVSIYVKPNSAAGALDSKYKVATWTGTGHHWANLAVPTSYTKYYVILWGGFNGSGAIYTEP